MEQGLTLMTDNLQEAINTLDPERTVTPHKQTSQWINAELRLLMSERNAINRRYCRTGSRQILDKFLNLANLCEEKRDAAQFAYMHNRVGETHDSVKNFWKELREL